MTKRKSNNNNNSEADTTTATTPNNSNKNISNNNAEKLKQQQQQQQQQQNNNTNNINTNNSNKKKNKKNKNKNLNENINNNINDKVEVQPDNVTSAPIKKQRVDSPSSTTSTPSPPPLVSSSTTSSPLVTPTPTPTANGSNAQRQPNPPPTDRPVRVYADGIYDLFHFGHAKSLEQAKRLFPNTYLIVGVCNDEMTHRLKGKTVMTDGERAESLRHCRWVDEVVENAPWVVTQEFIDEHKIDFVSHGEDACLDKDGNDIYQFVKDQGKFMTIKRTDGISTSDIILRIVKDYDSYVMRNLKRGYTGKEMNVGVFKENALKVEEKINQLKSKVRDSVDQFKVWSNENHMRDFLMRFSKRIPNMKIAGVPNVSSPSQEYLSPENDFIFDEDDVTSPKSPSSTGNRTLSP